MRLVPLVLLAGVTLASAAAEGVQARFTGGTTIFADDGPVYETTIGGSVRLCFSRRWSFEPEFLHARAGSDRNYFLWGSGIFTEFTAIVGYILRK